MASRSLCSSNVAVFEMGLHSLIGAAFFYTSEFSHSKIVCLYKIDSHTEPIYTQEHTNIMDIFKSNVQRIGTEH